MAVVRLHPHHVVAAGSPFLIKGWTEVREQRIDRSRVRLHLVGIEDTAGRKVRQRGSED